jgi:TetR/AcrR family transcriptional regulator, cholesterol catabolism regulator
MEDYEVKEKILAGSEALFMRYGIRSVSMDDIARHLSVSKKTLYQHFADKDELVTVMSQEHMKRDVLEYEQISRESENSIDELNKISIRLRCDMEEMNPSLLYDLQKFHPKAWALWQQHKNGSIMSSIVRNLKQGISEGYYRDDIHTEVIALSRLILIESAFDERIFPKDKYNLVEVQSQFFDHFVYGICTDKGRRLYQKYKQHSEQPNIPSNKTTKHESIL